MTFSSIPVQLTSQIHCFFGQVRLCLVSLDVFKTEVDFPINVDVFVKKLPLKFVAKPIIYNTPHLKSSAGGIKTSDVWWFGSDE